MTPREPNSTDPSTTAVLASEPVHATPPTATTQRSLDSPRHELDSAQEVRNGLRELMFTCEMASGLDLAPGQTPTTPWLAPVSTILRATVAAIDRNDVAGLKPLATEASTFVDGMTDGHWTAAIGA